MRCLEFRNYEHEGLLVLLQIKRTGEVSRICFAIHDSILRCTDTASANLDHQESFCPDPKCCLAESLIEPFLGSDMLVRFDKLCESLGSTLVEVVLAVAHERPYTLKDLFKPMRTFRDHMPTMMGRGCLSFRTLRSRCTSDEWFDDNTKLENIFQHNDRYWNKVVLDD